MYIPDFIYHKPKSLSEALSILKVCEKGILIAGGTDLLVEIKKGVRKVTDLISLSDVAELREIDNNDDYIKIGPSLTHNDVMNSTIIKHEFPALSEACSKVGSHQIRNSATIGGNLCTGASCADTAPILLAYEASVKLSSVGGEHIVPLKEFIINHHVTTINSDEIMTGILINKSKLRTVACFEKFGLREAASISVASSSSVLKFDNDNCISARIVVGACGPIPIVSENAGSFLEGRTLKELIDSDDLLAQAGELASNDSKPISDIRGSADYRRHLVKILTVAAIRKSLNQIAN
jgi:CO/xanthine dehydrogenase FAD-binding subunit